jgi:preprotein translocase subunit SecE
MNEWVQKAIHFFKEAYAELRKVTWLSRKEAVGSTVVIIILVVIVAIFVGIVDFVLTQLLGILL